MKLSSIERTISSDYRHLFTLISCFLVLLVYINLTASQSQWVGLSISVAYFLINATFLGSAFFREEEPFLRLTLGSLSLIMLLTFIGWLVLVIYNLDSARTTLVLASATIFSSLSNERMKQRKC